MKVELEIPKEYEKLVKNVNWKEMLPRAIAKGIEQELRMQFLFKKAKQMALKSKLSDKDALELGELLKERVAKRHGL
jgi:ribosomal protein S3